MVGSMTTSPLIPGLPDEVARECLVRVPHTAFSTVRSVCKLWKDGVDSPAFHTLRKSIGLSRTVVAMVQNESLTNSASSSAPTPTFRLSLFEQETGTWSTLPTIPALHHGLPLFCQIAGVGQNLVVIGGWDPTTLAALDEVFVFDFMSRAWRRGARMPGPRRSFFACASDLDRMVFVAGGHDEEKNALRSALAYDVAEDGWVPLPAMAMERDECKGVFHGGKFQVLGGYSTEFQGKFGKSSETFDPVVGAWEAVEEETLEKEVCPRTCVAGMGLERRLYRCCGGRVERKEDGEEWDAVAEVPAGARVATWMLALKGEEEEDVVMVVGSACHGGLHEGYVLEAEKGRWRTVEVPAEYSGHVQAGCCLMPGLVTMNYSHLS